MVQNSAAPVSPDNLPAILQKDAIYAAVGKKTQLYWIKVVSKDLLNNGLLMVC